jgi:monooxygenase
MPEQARGQGFAPAAGLVVVQQAANAGGSSARADVAAFKARIEQTDFDVLVVGAGLSGIGVAYHLQRDCPRKSFVILEARGAIGGTWDLFRYPGIRSDSDMHTMGYRFRPWCGEKAIADGPSIIEYLKDTAREYGIDSKIRYHHKVRRASWSSSQARWTLEVQGPEGRIETYTCNFLQMCCGYYDYDAGYLPGWPGMERFKGKIVHPQKWPEDLDYAGKRVVVIGSGATAVTLVPAMADKAAHVTMLQRSPTYIVARPAKDPIANWLHAKLPARTAHTLARWKNILLQMYFYRAARNKPEAAKQRLIELAQAELGPGIDMQHFTPRYNPWDQRLCLVPDGDLFNVIREGKASVVTEEIDIFTKTGLRLRSGEELPADIIVTATGLVMKMLGGTDLVVDGRTVNPGAALSYKGMMLSDVPNLATTFGYTNASWTLKADLTAEYLCRILNRMDRGSYAYCTPRNADPSLVPDATPPLSSGYMQRAKDILPKQGSKRPWRLYQNYAKDMLALRFGSIDDGTLVFTRASVQPAPRAPQDAPTGMRAQPRTSPGGGRPKRMSLDGRTAVITGAGSGIGRAIAQSLARRGCHLALADINEAGLAQTVQLLDGAGIRISRHRLDVADRAAVAALPQAVLGEHGRVDLLFNNAGVGLAGTFDQVSEADFDWLLDINFGAVVRMTRAFLPHLKVSDEACIVNLSSLFGLISPAGQTAYSASKFAVRGFSNALRFELAGSNVGVTVVHPGGVATKIAENARRPVGTSNAEVAAQLERARRMLTMPPAQAGETIVQAVERRLPRVLVGRDAKMLALAERLAPVSYWRLLALLAPRPAKSGIEGPGGHP